MKTNSAQPINSNRNPKPKRPLSAYNLFYRFKRQKILEAVALGGAVVDKESISCMLASPPGLEDHPKYAPPVVSSAMLNTFRRENIRTALERNTKARDTRKRIHCKSSQGAWNGSINFVDLGKLMNASWRNCDAFAKSVLYELADEGRAHYRRRIDEYCRQHENVGEVTLASANEKKKAAKKKSPAGTLTSSKAPPLPQSKSDTPREDSVMNETAKAMARLATSAPSNSGSQMCSSFAKEKNHTVGPSSLLGLIVEKDIPNESNTTQKEGAHAMRSAVVPVAAFSSSQEISPVAFPHTIEERLVLRVRERLILRVRELERKLEGEQAARARIRAIEGARIRAIEGEIMSQQWNERNGLRIMIVQNGLGNVMPQDGAATMPPPAPPGHMFPLDGGPWGLFSASTVYPSAAYRATPTPPGCMPAQNEGPRCLFSAGTVRPSARAEMPLMWPSFTMSEIKLPEGFDGSPFKKRRIG